MYVYVSVCACVRVCAYACVRVCVYACVRVCVYVHAINANAHLTHLSHGSTAA